MYDYYMHDSVYSNDVDMYCVDVYMTLLQGIL